MKTPTNNHQGLQHSNALGAIKSAALVGLATMALLPSSNAESKLRNTYACTEANSLLGWDVDFSHNGDLAIAGGGNSVQMFHSYIWDKFLPLNHDLDPATSFGPAVSIAGVGHAMVGSLNEFGNSTTYRVDGTRVERGPSGSDAKSVDLYSNMSAAGSVPSSGAAGRVDIRTFDSATGTWVYHPGVIGEPSALGFGSSVALWGKTLVVGAPFQDAIGPGGGAVSGRGAVWVYEQNGFGWGLMEILSPPLTDALGANAKFGVEVNVSVYQGALQVVVGTNAGAAYVYERNGSTRRWDSGTRFFLNGAGSQVNPATNPTASVLTGAVAIHRDQVAFGALDDNKVILYKKRRGAWVRDEVITADAGQFFGASVDLCGGHMMVGAPLNDAEAHNGGAVFFYDLD